MSQVPNDVKAIKEAFEELLRDLSWATASQFPVGEELRERCAKAEQEIRHSWNEQLYGDQSSATGLAELVQSAKIMRALRERMEELHHVRWLRQAQPTDAGGCWQSLSQPALVPEDLLYRPLDRLGKSAIQNLKSATSAKETVPSGNNAGQ